MASFAEGGERELVLVGAGHAHVQVLRRFAMEPPPAVRLTLVVDTPLAVYSGMVPGFVAGQYRAAELEIDALPLARRARARVILAPAVGVDTAQRRIALRDRPSIPYDYASFDVGSTVAGLTLPGVQEHALPTRPIGRFVQRVEGLLTQARDHDARTPFQVVVVGAGAGGVELAFALRHRLASVGDGAVRVTLVQGGSRILPGYPDGVVERVTRHAVAAGIDIVCGRGAVAAEPGILCLEEDGRLPFDALLWVTGAVAGPLFRDAHLPTDSRGFVKTRPTLQVVGHDELFAVGDCATLRDFPDTPKAGVYAVRQGPFLIDNLRAVLADRPLRDYRPQRDFLTLLNLGDGNAIGGKWGFSFGGSWVMGLKDWIDRRFMRKFQILEDSGQLTPAFQRQPAMAGEGPMLCGGCAAKVGQSVLERALARLGVGAADPSVVLGLEAPDDAAAILAPGGELVVSSIDAFRAFTDDPFVVGRVAAVNAVSDLLAKNVAPRYALALVALPQDLDPAAAEETLFQVLAGARQALDLLAVTLLGGHTTTATTLMVGFQVEGFASAPDALLRLGDLAPGQRLILSKALGTGVLFYADMQGRARGPWIEAALEAMARSNEEAARAARRAGARAATDVTGFGLAGHLGAMLRASGLSAIVDVAALPTLPGAVELLAQGLHSTFHPENARLRRGLAISPAAATHPKLELLFDPQTSGGLLFGVDAERTAETVAALHAAGDEAAAVIGQVMAERSDGAPIEVCAGTLGEP